MRAYYAIVVASALTDAAVMRVRESTADYNKLGPAPYEAIDENTKQLYKAERDLDLYLNGFEGYGIPKDSDLFRCHGTCGLLMRILRLSCKHELAQDFVDYCLGHCQRDYPGAVYPSSTKLARECNLEPREKAKPTQPETESPSKSTAASLPTSTAQVSHDAPSPVDSTTTAPQPETTPSISVADESSATMEPEVTLHTSDTAAAAAAGPVPTYSHAVDDSPDSSRDTSEVQELDDGDAATPTQMGPTATATSTTTASTSTSHVKLTSSSSMRAVNLLVAGAAALTSLTLTVIV